MSDDLFADAEAEQLLRSGWLFHDGDACPWEEPLSDSAKYRMTGNGTARNVIEWIAKRISEVAQKETAT